MALAFLFLDSYCFCYRFLSCLQKPRCCLVDMDAKSFHCGQFVKLIETRYFSQTYEIMFSPEALQVLRKLRFQLSVTIWLAAVHSLFCTYLLNFFSTLSHLPIPIFLTTNVCWIIIFRPYLWYGRKIIHSTRAFFSHLPACCSRGKTPEDDSEFITKL